MFVRREPDENRCCWRSRHPTCSVGAVARTSDPRALRCGVAAACRMRYVVPGPRLSARPLSYAVLFRTLHETHTPGCWRVGHAAAGCSALLSDGMTLLLGSLSSDAPGPPLVRDSVLDILGTLAVNRRPGLRECKTTSSEILLHCALQPSRIAKLWRTAH